MTKTQKIPADVQAEAERAAGYHGFENQVRSIARALLTRDTAARKECAELVRANEEVTYLNSSKRALQPRTTGNLVGTAYATAIEATIRGEKDG